MQNKTSYSNIKLSLIRKYRQDGGIMEQFIETIIVGIIAFITTNIDDLFILSMLFSNNNYDNKKIVIGQYIGILSLILVSSISYFARFLIPIEWIGLSGLIPIVLGLNMFIKKLKNNTQNEDDSDSSIPNPIRSQIFLVSSITFANGGDNIGIYAPFFASSGLYQLSIIVATFLVMVAIWCIISYFLSTIINKNNTVKKLGDSVLPIVLIGLGLFIIIQSNTLSLFYILIN